MAARRATPEGRSLYLLPSSCQGDSEQLREDAVKAELVPDVHETALQFFTTFALQLLMQTTMTDFSGSKLCET